MKRIQAAVLAVMALAGPAASAAGWQVEPTLTAVAGDTPNAHATLAGLSADGSLVFFNSAASDVAPGFVDNALWRDGFLWDRQSNVTTLLTHVQGDPQRAVESGERWRDSTIEGVSADGRWVVIASPDLELIGQSTSPLASHFFRQLFLLDRQTGVMRLITHVPDQPDVPAGYYSNRSAVITPDGRFVAFSATSQALLPEADEPNGSRTQTFVYDRDADRVERVSVSPGNPGNSVERDAYALAISDDGQRIVFGTESRSVLPGTYLGANWDKHVLYLRDRAASATTLVSRRGDLPQEPVWGDSVLQDGSPDLRWLLYTTEGTRPGTQDANGALHDLWLYDAQSGQTRLVSRSAASETTTADGDVLAAVMDDDANRVVYSTTSGNVVVGVNDANGAAADVYAWSRATGATVLLSHAHGQATTTADGASGVSGIASDGSHVLLETFAANVLAGVSDVNRVEDIYAANLANGGLTLVSHRAGAPLVTADAASRRARFAQSGAEIVFESGATDLVPGLQDNNGAGDIFVFGVDDGEIEAVALSAGPAALPETPNAGSRAVALSDDGRYLLIESLASNHLAGLREGGWTFSSEISAGNTSPRLYQLDRSTGGIALVDHAWQESLSTVTRTVHSGQGRMSSDGRYVVFLGKDPRHGPEVNDLHRLLRWDRDTGDIELVSRANGLQGEPANDAAGLSSRPAMSRDGRWIAFSTRATNLSAQVPADSWLERVWLRDMQTGTTLHVTEPFGEPQRHPSGSSYPRAVSDDGEWVLIDSLARNLSAPSVDYGKQQCWLWQRSTGEFRLVTHAAAGATTFAHAGGSAWGMSGDGRWVLFASASTEFVDGVVDGNGSAADLFLYDRSDGSLRLVTHAAGDAMRSANGAASSARLTPDGRHVLFASTATDLVAGQQDTNASRDVFVWSRDSGTARLVSHAHDGALVAVGGEAKAFAVSDDATRIGWESSARNVVAGAIDGNDVDVFVFDASDGSNTLVSRSTSAWNRSAALGSAGAAMNAAGDVVAFSSASTDLVDGMRDINAAHDVFVASEHAPLLLQYSSGAHGTLDGPLSQEVAYGFDGQPVTAIPADGYYFAGWSDGFPDGSPRVDRNVTASRSATAVFAQGSEEIFRDGF